MWLRGSPSGVNSVTFKVSQEGVRCQWVEGEVRSEARGKLGQHPPPFSRGTGLSRAIYTGVPSKMSFKRKSLWLKGKYLKTAGIVHTPPLQRFNGDSEKRTAFSKPECV